MSQLQIEGIGMTSKRTRDRLVQRLIEQGIKLPTILDLMANTPRHLFLDEALSHRAYEDTALPIGHGQTLSQPYIVARMTELLLMHAPDLSRVLEVGTGSGYQTAILAQISDRVWSVERIKPLQDKARQRIRQLKMHNVQFKLADGGFGWPEHGPYTAILSAAAPPSVPQELLQQLDIGGVLIIPVGESQQALTMVKRIDDQEFETTTLEPVKFVPLLTGIVRG